MPTNKEFTKLANQLSQLAKFYLSHLNGPPAEVAKQEKALLSHVRKAHQQLRVKGTALMRGTGLSRTFDDACQDGYTCPDGSCVPDLSCCSHESGFIAEPVPNAKSVAKKPVKKAAKKKK